VELQNFNHWFIDNCKTNYTSTLKNLEFSTRVGTIVGQKKVPKQAGVVHNIKSQ